MKFDDYDKRMDVIHMVHRRLSIMMQQPEVFGPWYINRELQMCSDGECEECSKIVCPHNDPMHFHHDGCPSCSQDNRV